MKPDQAGVQISVGRKTTQLPKTALRLGMTLTQMVSFSTCEIVTTGTRCFSSGMSSVINFSFEDGDLRENQPAEFGRGSSPHLKSVLVDREMGAGYLLLQIEGILHRLEIDRLFAFENAGFDLPSQLFGRCGQQATPVGPAGASQSPA